MSEIKEPTFILYRNGQALIVSQGEWEKDWLRWWERTYTKQ